jgi:hypothetical protein
MTTMTLAPAAGAFARDPFYALAVADAYDEYNAGETIDTLKRRADELLDADYPQTQQTVPAELYRIGYGNTVVGLMNAHIATVNAQAEVAHKWMGRKKGPATSTRHRRHTAGGTR